MSKVIAIDGPSGSGKSTVAKCLARALNVLYIDTGSMYRTLGLRAHELSINLEDPEALADFLAKVNLKYGVSEQILVQIDDVDYTQKIREHHVSKLASVISQIKEVRSFLVDYQRKMAGERVCVMEGRDIGTVVFPDAFAKFFVTASVEVRAGRRLEQLREQGNTEAELEQIMQDIHNRDQSDINRDHAPLKQAEDAVLVDSSHMSLEEVVAALVELVKEKASLEGISL